MSRMLEPRRRSAARSERRPRAAGCGSCPQSESVRAPAGVPTRCSAPQDTRPAGRPPDPAHSAVTADTTNCPETAMKLPGGGHENCPTRFRLPRRVPRLRPLLGCGCGAEAPTAPRRDTVKSAEEIMNMLDAFDLTESLRDAGELAGVSHHTVARYVAARDFGVADRGVTRPMLIDQFLPKVEEWVDRSNGKVRADVAHDKLVAVGCTARGSPSLVSGFNTTSVTARSSTGSRRRCSVLGWRGRGSGWCWLSGTRPPRA